MSPLPIHSISQILGTPKRDCIYDILGYLHLRLCVDVGAAAGNAVVRICEAGGPSVRVIAFEPFPGNHGFFQETTRECRNVELIKKAVSDRAGPTEFVVPSVVHGSERGWEKFAGYSSVGFLSSRRNRAESAVGRSLQWGLGKIIDTALWRAPARKLVVEATTIDKEFAGQAIDFMKIDVQGGERSVLTGADTMLRAQKISVLYMEWSGHMDLVERLANRNYWICDSVYVAGPKVHNIKPFEDIGFKFLDEIRLSTGRTAYELLLTPNGLSPEQAMKEVEARRLGWIQTDLIAVSENALPSFLEAVKRYGEVDRGPQSTSPCGS